MTGVRVVAPAGVAKCLEKRRPTAETHRNSSHHLLLFKFSGIFFVFSLSKQTLFGSVPLQGSRGT